MGSSANAPDVVVVGAGVFGLSAAMELRRRDRSVVVIDPGPVPHPLAASTDRSKIVRLDYGSDALYTRVMANALQRWRRMPPGLFHETGVLFLSQSSLEHGGFEQQSAEVLTGLGHPIERLDRRTLRSRFPAWNADRFPDGYHNPQGGWADSGRVIEHMAREAESAGAELRLGFAVARLIERDGRVEGVVLTDGSRVLGGDVVIATGAWTPHLLPETASFLRSPGQPVFWLKPADPALFSADHFPVWAADIANTGWYGFPVGDDGIVKVARHGIGRHMHPESPDRHVGDSEERDLRTFLSWAIPPLADAPIVYTRICLYADSPDGHLWIARDPKRRGLVIATGDSGHAFKLAPLLGEWIADVLEDGSGEALRRFGWREGAAWQNEEAARSGSA